MAQTITHEPVANHPGQWAAHLSRFGHRAIDVFLVFWLFVSTGALFPLLASGGTATFDADTAATLRLLLLPSLVMAPILLLTKQREITALFLSNPLLIALLLWVWTSLSWSIDPAISARRALALTTNSVITCYLVSSYEISAVVRRLLLVCFIALSLNAICLIFSPSFAFSSEDGRFRGIFTHKSVLGQFLIISTFVLLLSSQERLATRSIIIVGFLLVFAIGIPTKSVTALLLIPMLLTISILPDVFKIDRVRSWTLVFFVLTFTGVMILVGTLFIDDLMAFIGRDLTFTGRTGIWFYVFSYIERRPLLGYGYGAFFGDQDYILQLKQTFLFDLTGAHSGYLQTWLDLGLIGLGIAVLFLMTGFVQSIRRLSSEGDIAARFGFFWLLLYFGRNLVESDLLSQSQMSWPLALLGVLFQSAAIPSRASEMPRRSGRWSDLRLTWSRRA